MMRTIYSSKYVGRAYEENSVRIEMYEHQKYNAIPVIAIIIGPDKGHISDIFMDEGFEPDIRLLNEEVVVANVYFNKQDAKSAIERILRTINDEVTDTFVEFQYQKYDTRGKMVANVKYNFKVYDMDSMEYMLIDEEVWGY